MVRHLTRFAALMLLASSPPAAPLHLELDRLIDRAEVDCLMRAPEDGVRWYWDGSYCVGLIVGRLEE